MARDTRSADPDAALGRLRQTIAAMRRDLQAAGIDDLREHETHISVVLLAGEHAYKFKKPVNLGFLDFSTVERRRYFCEREVSLNRRFAPHLYLGVQSVPVPGGGVEYAVKMRRFEDRSTLDVLADADRLDLDTVTALAGALAAAHAAVPAVARDSALGGVELVSRQLHDCLQAPLDAQLPPDLDAMLRAALQRVRPLLAVRHAEGHVRACHGDLHLSNVVLHEGRPVPFDCIEFSDELSVIDTMSDAAFLLMDLDFHGAARLGNAFLNAYLDASGDHQGLAVLPHYLAYRTLVRAKVALLGATGAGTNAGAARRRARAHVELARSYLQPGPRPGLVITHGLSGSGKSHQARRLALGSGFVHLRSDVERKRLVGLAATASSASGLDTGLYTAASSAATYARLREAAASALGAGFSTIVDATFLGAADRQAFRDLAVEQGADFHILSCDAPPDELRRRVARRAARGDDVSEAGLEVLEAQLRSVQPLRDDELGVTLTPASPGPDDDGPLHAARLGRVRPG